MNPTKKFAMALGVMLYLSIGYFGLGQMFDGYVGETYVSLPFDSEIPLIPASVWIYLLGLYIPIFYVIYIIESERDFRVAAISIALSATICFAAFICVPMSYPQPEVVPLSSLLSYPVLEIPGDSLSTQLLAWVYTVDSSANTFPSLHLVFCMGFVLAIYRSRPRVGKWLLLNTVLVYISTLTTKQHFILDGIVGIGLVSCVFWLVERRMGSAS